MTKKTIDEPGTIFTRKWEALGEEVRTHVASRTPFPVKDTIRTAESIITELVWRSIGDNLSYVAPLLQISRRRVRLSLAKVRPVR